ncbi:hypothetical protein OG562_17175 [Streptomyces sp. NBC_01275]|uniref:hypothetical protein n=1 Tax=Streptomyces sp. NBC_01275 TaxID=2903807 RepID=UPI00225390F7|nr:hypothetical protein [Streptomyces sp. NBC_01275]MCX4762678.1 hypothetical protein [Streptomyces sp. NBC_01275]
MTISTATGAERRLEAGWFQRLAWAALVWVSLGFLVWVPFLYVAIRRGRPSDWGAFASFTLYECVILPWSLVTEEGDGDAILGVVVVVTMLMATGLLLFALFDARTRPAPAPAYGAGAPNPYGQPTYQQGSPYGR